MTLPIRYFGQDLDAEPIMAHGLGILCRGKLGQIFILEHNAKDREQFWRTWRDLGGERQGIRYEGGAAFKPPLPDEKPIDRSTFVARLRRATAEFWAAIFPRQ